MKLVMVAVLDLATQIYARPFFVSHPAQAMRSFQDEVNNPQSELGKHADDYELWDLGSWDDTSGRFTSVEPVRIVRAADLKKG